MRAGDHLDIHIGQLGAQGDGLSRIEGSKTLIYVPLALAGETVKVKLGAPVGNGFSSKMIEVITPSPDRVAPSCRYFERCGGCAVQHLAMPAYRAWKLGQLKTTLAFYQLGEAPLRDMVEVAINTRRRISLTAMADKAGKVFLGFTEKASHQIVDIKSCDIAHPALVEALPLVREALSPWIRKARELNVMLTHTESGLDVVVTGKEPDLAAREGVAALALWAGLARVSWRKRMQDPTEPLLGLRNVVQTLDDVVVDIPAGGFLQPSAEGQAALTALVCEATADGPIIELFAGSGSFTFPLAHKGRVTAYESEKPAVEAITSAARRATHLPHEVQGIARDLFRDPLLPDEFAELNAKTVVLDPPRAGAEAQCKEIAKAGVPRVVMVSCNPATFGRDAGHLLAAGYVCDWIQPVDQFIWSPHLEIVGQFTKA